MLKLRESGNVTKPIRIKQHFYQNTFNSQKRQFLLPSPEYLRKWWILIASQNRDFLRKATWSKHSSSSPLLPFRARHRIVFPRRKNLLSAITIHIIQAPEGTHIWPDHSEAHSHIPPHWQHYGGEKCPFSTALLQQHYRLPHRGRSGAPVLHYTHILPGAFPCQRICSLNFQYRLTPTRVPSL